MNSAQTSILMLVSLVATVLAGKGLRRRLPEAHLSTESRDAVKLAMGLVSTMTALLLGLLVGSAKGTYDTQRTEIIQMAAQVGFLDRVLTSYGPEAAEARAQFRDAVTSRPTLCGPPPGDRGPRWLPRRRPATASSPPSRASPRATIRSAA